jgi:hypothetical protein
MACGKPLATTTYSQREVEKTGQSTKIALLLFAIAAGISVATSTAPSLFLMLWRESLASDGHRSARSS